VSRCTSGLLRRELNRWDVALEIFTLEKADKRF